MYEYGDGLTPKRGDCEVAPLPPGQKCPRCKGAQTLVTEQCNDIPDWVRELVAPILVTTGVLKSGWANSAVVNLYSKRGGKLLAHFDSPHLFERPIIAISLFSTKGLHFGVKGFGMTPQDYHYEIGMPRGAVTVMSGFAADKINHGVPPVKGKAATLLLRRMHPSLLGPKWVENNAIWVE